jgi:hypothetical protein
VYEWTVGSFPVPTWIVENPDWSILRNGDEYYFEPKSEDGKGAASVWLVKAGEVIRWVESVWYCGEEVIS